MFYSHTFLARKGPLGTVWCAAHLQHKLKKSHYTSTDISSTVERIMFPEVPIALRMSGHLLLGVVRIYSKKVDYLYQDCNVVLIGIKTAFSTAVVNLPADANKAPVHTVTLPDTFDLDAWDFDDDFNTDRFQDNHLRSQEEITLAGHIPAEYVGITIDEDVLKDLSPDEDPLALGPHPMEEDSNPTIPVDTTPDFQDRGPSNQTGGINERRDDENSPEVRRDAVHDFPLGDNDDQLEPDRVLEKHLISDKEMLTPNATIAEMSVPEPQSFPSEHHQEPPPSASDHAHNTFEDRDGSLNFEVYQSAPHVEQQQPQQQPEVRRRIRRQRFDEETVLRNEFMKTALIETSDIRRKRRNCPQSALGVWRLNKRLKKDEVFSDPILTGLSDDLHNLFTEDLISSKPHLVSTESTQPAPTVPSTSAQIDEFDTEIEHFVNNEGAPSDIPDIFPTPNRLIPCTSERQDDFTPGPQTNLGSEQVATTSRTGVSPTPDMNAHTGSFVSDMETPIPFSEERFGFDNTGLSDIPEMDYSANGELSFLEDDNTPAGVQGTPEVDILLRKENGTPEINALSVRTRAVAQFLIKKALDNPTTDDESGELSMDKILAGKTRKVSARMFYETLVLKSCGLVDLEQEEAYGDIRMKLTPKLSKEQFSA